MDQDIVSLGCEIVLDIESVAPDFLDTDDAVYFIFVQKMPNTYFS